jgi:hypothetical protein
MQRTGKQSVCTQQEARDLLAALKMSFMALPRGTRVTVVDELRRLARTPRLDSEPGVRQAVSATLPSDLCCFGRAGGGPEGQVYI